MIYLGNSREYLKIMIYKYFLIFSSIVFSFDYKNFRKK